MMKKLTVSFEGTSDSTGYLFSLAKCLSAALRCSRYAEYADDIVASSGFAFRMWVAPDLCPSATSIWEYRKQKPWVESGGLVCGYVERLWGEDSVEEERRREAVEMIKSSIDQGVAAIAWDVSGCEWGVIDGYEDETQTLHTLKISGEEGQVPYDRLGRLELPILSVLTVRDKAPKTASQLVDDTKSLAAAHLRGEEWCDNASGLAAYDALTESVGERYTEALSWNLDYYLGTYAALKRYAWKFFEKYGETRLAEGYQAIHEAWQRAYAVKTAKQPLDERGKQEILSLLEKAKALESEMLEALEKG